MIAPYHRRSPIPRWIIDDTTRLAEARVYLALTQYPRFFAELLPPRQRRSTPTERTALNAKRRLAPQPSLDRHSR